MIDFGALLKNKNLGERFYLTKEGMEAIKKEYERLITIKLAQTKGEIPQFLHSDELNQEYFDFQNDIDLLEARMADLKYIIDNSELIKKPSKDKQNIVQLGARVLVEINGEIDEFRIVSSIEANPSLGMISNESPVGKALLGHKVGDEIIISSPVRTCYKIKKIKYS